MEAEKSRVGHLEAGNAEKSQSKPEGLKTREVKSVSPTMSPKIPEPGMLISEDRRRWVSQLRHTGWMCPPFPFLFYLSPQQNM